MLSTTAASLDRWHYHLAEMAEVVPSYMRKLERAEKHLADLRTAIDEWSKHHPYEVHATRHRRRTAFHLVFTEDPINTDIGIIAADLVYNLRSGLDHLAAALVLPKNRNSTYFPIFFEGVWEPTRATDTEQQKKERGRWLTITDTMKPEAVALLKKMQPAISPGGDRVISALLMLNRLSNTDRHRQLPVFAKALRAPVTSWREGSRLHAGGDTRTTDPSVVLEDGAELKGLPRRATNVQIRGQPVVAVRVCADGKTSTLELPDSLQTAITVVREHVVAPLMVHIVFG